MRTSIIQVVLTSLLVCSGAVYGADLSEYEKTCLDLGFKKRTPAYGECVLELDKRSTDQQKQGERARGDQQRQAQEQQERQATLQRQQQERDRAAQLAERGDGSADHQTCRSYGVVLGTPQYADCRLKLDVAKRELEQRRAEMEAAAKRESDRVEAEQKKERSARQAAAFKAMSEFGRVRPVAPPPAPRGPMPGEDWRYCTVNPNAFDCR